MIIITSECQDWFAIADINKKYSSKFCLTVLFLSLKFCKKLGFFLRDLCEWGNWSEKESQLERKKEESTHVPTYVPENASDTV
jgi:hypothetical protein